MAENNERENIFTLTDEEGNESEFELIGELEMNGEKYLALIPLDGDDDEYVVLKETFDENGEQLLVTIDDDEEFDAVADKFEDTFMEECDLDAEIAENAEEAEEN